MRYHGYGKEVSGNSQNDGVAMGYQDTDRKLPLQGYNIFVGI